MQADDSLLAKLKVLSQTIWEQRAKEPEINEWLGNFATTSTLSLEKQRTHALYLLSQFTYFGQRQVKELMRVLYRDHFRYPIIERIRRGRNDTTDLSVINAEYDKALKQTLFLGLGNPSESGTHLLYPFRQESGLGKDRFIFAQEVTRRKWPTPWQMLKSALSLNWNNMPPRLVLRRPKITRYVLIDDFCGSGHQGESYSDTIVKEIKSLDPSIEVWYFVLVATSTGMKYLQDHTNFDVIKCIFELDDSFKCFSTTSRYFPSHIPEVTQDFAETMCATYGDQLFPGASLGYDDCQLLFGFSHNTPDNTLPIFWYDEAGGPNWIPIFKRYTKH